MTVVAKQAATAPDVARHRCPTGKVPHATPGEAQTAAERMNARGDNLGVTTAYQCRTCEAWHIGRKWKPSTAMLPETLIINAPWLGPAFRSRRI